MSEWFQQQFGDRGQFAVCISLGVDPHPCGQPARDLTWGTLEIWTRDRCLTASVSDSGVSQGIRWSLLPVLEWLIHVGVRLVNEDPYPRFSKGRDVADGAEWIDATLSPPRPHGRGGAAVVPEALGVATSPRAEAGRGGRRVAQRRVSTPRR